MIKSRYFAHLANNLFVFTIKMINNGAHMTNSILLVSTMINNYDTHMNICLSVVYDMINNHNAHMTNILFVLSTRINVVDVVSLISTNTCDFGTCTYVIGKTVPTKTKADLPSRTMGINLNKRLYLHAYKRMP